MPELATPPRTPPLPSTPTTTPSPHPLPKPSQWEIRVTAATLIFPLWVHLPAEKGSRWCNLKPWSTPPGTLVFPVPSIFSMKFLCLSQRAPEGGRKGGWGRRSVAAAEKKNTFFSLQSVRELKGGVLEAGYSEEVCLPFGHFVLELAAHTGGRFAFRVTLLKQITKTNNP